jgi:hypothetical protein
MNTDFKNISIISPNLDVDQKEKIKEIYIDKNIEFNKCHGSDHYTIILNYFESEDGLCDVLDKLKSLNRYRVMQTKDMIDKINNHRIYKSKKSHYYQIPIVSPVEFIPKKSLILDPYLLGCFLGDCNSFFVFKYEYSWYF